MAKPKAPDGQAPPPTLETWERCDPKAPCHRYRITDARRLTHAQRATVTLCPAHSREVAEAMEAGAWERVLRALGVLGGG
jgi:hypothetical protein